VDTLLFFNNIGTIPNEEHHVNTISEKIEAALWRDPQNGPGSLKTDGQAPSKHPVGVRCLIHVLIHHRLI
jgi:hypothetical protein